MKILASLLSLLLLNSYLALAAPEQQIRICGQVTTKEGLGISQAQIRSAGKGTISDRDGYFCLYLEDSDDLILEISHIGFETKTISDLKIDKATVLRLAPVILIPHIYTSQTTVVTATRSLRTSQHVPRAVNVIPQTDIGKRQPATSSEALRGENGVTIQKTNHGGGSAIIRGFSANRILLMVDGFRLNNSLFRMGNHQYLTMIDFGMLDRIEVLRGPASSLFGSDALGGTIQLFTLQEDYSDSSVYAGHVFAQTATADRQLLGNFATKYRGQKIFIGLNWSLKKYGDLYQGRYGPSALAQRSLNGRKQSPSAYQGYDYLLKTGWQVDSRQRFIFAAQGSRQFNVPRYDKYENNSYHLWEYEPQQRNLSYLKYRYTPATSLLTMVQTGISWQHLQVGRRIQKTSASDLQVERDGAHTIGGYLQTRSMWDSQELILGVESYFDIVHSNRKIRVAADTAFVVDPQSRFPDGATYWQSAIFMQHIWKAGKQLEIFSGVRGNFFRARYRLTDFENTFQPSFRAVSATLGFAWNVHPAWTIKSNLANAFRAPNLSDLARFGESKGDIFEVPNPRLHPERMVEMEMALGWNFPSVQGEWAVYFADVEDLVERADGLYGGSPFLEHNGQLYTVKTRKNVGQGHVYGWELQGNWQPSAKIILYGNAMYTYGRQLDTRQPMSSIPPLNGLSGLRWSFHKAAELNLFLRFAFKQHRLSEDDRDDPRIPPGGSPGWQTLNARLTWKPRPALYLILGVENISDRIYREHASGINGPGRNFVLSCRYSF